MYDTGHMRVSDADRESVVARLTVAATEGRLSLPEFEERSGRAYASSTWNELAVVLSDLPYPPLVPHAPVYAQPAASPTNPLAAVSLIAGVVSILGLTFAPVAPLAGIAAIVLGVLGLRKAGELPGRTGRGAAWGGIATGIGGIAVATAFVFLFITP